MFRTVFPIAYLILAAMCGVNRVQSCQPSNNYQHNVKSGEFICKYQIALENITSGSDHLSKQCHIRTLRSKIFPCYQGSFSPHGTNLR